MLLTFLNEEADGFLFIVMYLLKQLTVVKKKVLK